MHSSHNEGLSEADLAKKKKGAIKVFRSILFCLIVGLMLNLFTGSPIEKAGQLISILAGTSAILHYMTCMDLYSDKKPVEQFRDFFLIP